MKALVLGSTVLSITIAVALSFTGCNRETPTGMMTIKLTDAPANYLQVNIDITGLQVHTETHGWVSVPIEAGVYDLLTLQNDVTAVLADSAFLPAGRVQQMRLLLGPNSSLLTTTGLYSLVVPSGSETGLKVNINKELQPNSVVQVVLDFDATASVVETGNGGYVLKPVIKLKSIN